MLLRDLMRGDVRSALTLASPDELAVLHDYGGLITQSLPSFGQSHVSVKTLDLTTVPLSGGAVRVVLHRLALATPNGPVSVSVAGSCYRVSTRDQSRRICADQLPFSGLSGTESCSGGVRIDRNGHRHRYGQNCTHTKTTLPPAQKRALTDLFSSVTKVGVVTTQTGGRWFLAPVRTVSDLGSVLLSGLRGNDLLELIKLGK